MARFIRLYDSPNKEYPANILGFSSGISYAALDPEIHEWLGRRGYNVTLESEEQLNGRMRIWGGLAIRTAEYLIAPGIPLPENTVSTSHIHIEPPIKDQDLRPFGEFLMNLDSIDDGDLRQHLFIDNRFASPEPHKVEQDQIITLWG